jgi:hypothetical protein
MCKHPGFDDCPDCPNLDTCDRLTVFARAALQLVMIKNQVERIDANLGVMMDTCLECGNNSGCPAFSDDEICNTCPRSSWLSMAAYTLPEVICCEAAAKEMLKDIEKESDQ